MTLTSNLVPHEISAANLIMGSSRFITLWMPPEWNLAPGVGRPEIVAAHERNDVKWVASGKGWYVVYNGEDNWVMEMKLDIAHPREKWRPAGELLAINGHEGQVRWWERGRGILRRQMVTYMEVAYNCPQSERSIRLEFSGRCPEEGFRALLGFLPHWRCH